MLTSWLTGFLDQIVCWIQTALVEFANLCLAAIGAVVAAVIGVMPGFPSPPDWSDTIGSDVIGFANWFVPINFAVGWIGTFAVIFLVWKGIEIVLRWAKAVA